MSDELAIVYGLVLERDENYCNLAFRKGLLFEFLKRFYYRREAFYWSKYSMYMNRRMTTI